MILELSVEWVRYDRARISFQEDGIPVPFEWVGPLEVRIADVFFRAMPVLLPKRGEGEHEPR
jgi:hypothetical protein